MMKKTRVQIDPIQIHTELVGPIVATIHAIGIQQRYELEDKVFTESACTHVRLVQYEVQEAVEDVGRGCFARMHTTCEHIDTLVVEIVWPLSCHVRKKVPVETRFTHEIRVVACAYGDQIDAAFVQRFAQ